VARGLSRRPDAGLMSAGRHPVAVAAVKAVHTAVSAEIGVF
jgi:hypothetical protein